MNDQTFTCDFVGGPLDGPNQVHPLSNYQLIVEDHPEGYYELSMIGGKYHWIYGQPAWKIVAQSDAPKDKGGLGKRWLLRLARAVVKFLEGAGVRK